MADNMDKLLFSIGEEQDAKVDYDAVLAAILAKAPQGLESDKSAQKPKRKAGYWRSLGAAAAFVALLGAGVVFLSGRTGMSAPQMMEAASEEPAAAAPAAAPAEARGADVPAAYDGAMAAGETGTEALAQEAAAEEAPAAAAPAEAQAAPAPEPFASEAPAAEAPAEIIEDEKAENGDSRYDYSNGGSSGSLESHAIDADSLARIGSPAAGFEERLREAGLEVSPGEYHGGVTPGSAYLGQDGRGGFWALWNTGEGFYLIEGEGLGREELIELLESAL